MDTSHPCCQIPPVVTSGYKEKGTYTEVDGLKTYVTGPSDAKYGLVLVYDIFGFFPQTLQGADILAYADKERQYRVFVPDFLDGKYADLSWFAPPETKEKSEKLGNLFANHGAPPKNVEKLLQITATLKNQNSSIEKWGALGYCWGGKVVTLSSAQNTPFNAAAQVHPAMVDPNDATNTTIPMLLLASGDESVDDVKKFNENLKVKCHVETFSDQLHGWMAARADLEDARVKSEYERGYRTVSSFFHEHL
ncbi:MAG: hypothetical protein M1833_006332 [Piccolia ochrophora]|nr:MAG: hypothetical protein M1833_006332 [Piccolia ochrophora]